MNNRFLKALISGLAGAVTLTIAHQFLKKVTDKAPEMDKVGMNALADTLESMNIEIPKTKNLYTATMVGDLISNSLYYSMNALGSKPILISSVLGAAAGAGAISLPGPMHLGKEYSGKTNTTKLLTMGIYMLGSYTSSTVFHLLQKKD